MAVWATGVGLPIAGADGQETTAAQQLCNCNIYTAFIQNGATLIYAGAAPGSVTDVGPPSYAPPATNPANLSRSILPPDTIATTLPPPARPESAAATAHAAAPSMITRFRSATIMAS